MKLQICRFIFFLLFFSPFLFVLSDEGEFCDPLDHWKIPVCAKTDEERVLKSNHLHNQLKASLLRKKILPKEATEAGKAVFQIGTQFSFHGYEWGFSGGSGFFMFDTETFFTAYHALESIFKHGSGWNEIVFKDQNGNQQGFRIKGIKFASKLRDIIVLEVEGYEGPILELSMEPLQEQSLISLDIRRGLKYNLCALLKLPVIIMALFLNCLIVITGLIFLDPVGGLL